MLSNPDLTGAATAGGRISWRELDGVRTRILDAGPRDGQAVVLLHGVGGHLEAFGRLVSALAATFRVVAVDLPGHGWSDAPDRDYEVDGYLPHVHALIDELGLGRPDLVGLSLGGWIAGRLAITAPERVRRLVLVAPGGVRADPAVMHALRTLSTAAAAAPSTESVRARLEWLMADPSTVTDDLVATRLAIYQRPGHAEAMRQVLCLQDPAIRERNLIPPAEWARITAPTLVLWGTQDATGPAQTGASLAGWIPGARFRQITGAGHWPQFERPEEVNSAISRFLGAADPIDTPRASSEEGRR